MIQNDGDLQKCQRANTFDRHPFIEWALPPPLSSGMKRACGAVPSAGKESEDGSGQHTSVSCEKRPLSPSVEIRDWAASDSTSPAISQGLKSTQDHSTQERQG